MMDQKIQSKIKSSLTENTWTFQEFNCFLCSLSILKNDTFRQLINHKIQIYSPRRNANKQKMSILVITLEHEDSIFKMSATEILF